MADLGVRWQKLTQPYKDAQNKPLHTNFISSHVGNLHGKIESRIYRYLQPESAYQCMNVIRTIPFYLLCQIFPVAFRATIGLAGALYSQIHPSSPSQIHARVKLMNSVATAFVFNAISAVSRRTLYQEDPFALAHIPMDLALATTYFFLASQLEKPASKASSKKQGSLT